MIFSPLGFLRIVASRRGAGFDLKHMFNVIFLSGELV